VPGGLDSVTTLEVVMPRARGNAIPLHVPLLLGLSFSLLFASTLGADDVYVVRFYTDILQRSTTECFWWGWRDHLVFRNTTYVDLTVRALSASNGYSPPEYQPLVVPARRNMSLLPIPGGGVGETGGSNNWTPRSSLFLIVNRLDVPKGVVVESRAEIYSGRALTPLPCSIDFPGSLPQVFGTLPLPVVTALVPAGKEHVHLATDLGTHRARANVTIYNGGPTSATASVEVRRGCDDVLLDNRSVTVPSTSIVQFFSFKDGRDEIRDGCPVHRTTEYNQYVTVVMDQPGFSFVTTLARDYDPKVNVSTSATR
jgi:hypothetical protein